MERHSELPHGQGEVAPISEINITPFIDIMLVLLIIFMVTALLMLGGVYINLPQNVGAPMSRPEKPLIVSMDAASQVFAEQGVEPAPAIPTPSMPIPPRSAGF